MIKNKKQLQDKLGTLKTLLLLHGIAKLSCSCRDQNASSYDQVLAFDSISIGPSNQTEFKQIGKMVLDIANYLVLQVKLDPPVKDLSYTKFSLLLAKSGFFKMDINLSQESFSEIDGDLSELLLTHPHFRNDLTMFNSMVKDSNILEWTFQGGWINSKVPSVNFSIKSSVPNTNRSYSKTFEYDFVIHFLLDFMEHHLHFAANPRSTVSYRLEGKSNGDLSGYNFHFHCRLVTNSKIKVPTSLFKS